MHTFVLTYIFAAVLGSSVFVLIGLRSSRATSTRTVLRFDSELSFNESYSELIDGHDQSNINVLIKVALKRLASIMVHHSIKMDVAISPGLTSQLPVEVGAQLVESLIYAIINHAPPGLLLLTAWEHKGRIAVRLIGDGGSVDSPTWDDAVCNLKNCFNLHNCTLDVDVSLIATSLTVWLPLAGPQ